MAEGFGVKVGPEVAIETGEDVAIEGCSGSGSVVVSGQQGGDALLRAGTKVGAEEKLVAGEKLGADVAEEGFSVGGREVADTGADVEGQSSQAGETVERERFAGIV